MYRRSLALLWLGTIVFGVAATLDAFIDFMRNAQGALIGLFALMFIGAILRMGFHQLNETAMVNRGKSEELQVDVEQKSRSLTNDIDRLRCKMDDLDGKVGETRDWVEAAALREEAKEGNPAPSEPEPDHEPCPIYQMRLRDGRREAIVGKRTPDPIDAASIFSVLEEGDAGRRPGTSAS